MTAEQLQSTLAAPRIYLPSEFARFSPRTALDLVRLVPGFVLAETDDRRGLGDLAQNVLINGRPIQGKANDARDALSRLTAADVVRIEISGGTNSESSGAGRQIANVIVKVEDSAKGQFSWRPSTRLRSFDPAIANGDASVTGKHGPLAYTIGVRNEGSRTGASGPSRILGQTGELVDLRNERFVEASDRPRVAADLRFDGPSDSIFQLRGSYQRFAYRFREQSDRSGPQLIDRTRLLTQRQKGRRYELGGDGEINLGPGRFKLIALHARQRVPVDTRVRTDFADDSAAIGTRFLRDGDETEDVVRSEYRFASGANQWLISAERAATSLRNVSSIFELNPDGGFDEVPMTGGSGTVRERRYETAVTLTRPLSPTLKLQGSVGGEISHLEVAGDVASERTFKRPKGYVSLAWEPSPRLRGNFKVQRRVGQISFFDFLASRNLLEERENASNPQLKPPQSWDVSAELSRDLAIGSTTLRAYGQQIQGLVELVPIGETQEGPGNLGRAYIYGFDWKTSLLFDQLGMRGVRVDTRVQLQQSRIDDPVTGRGRRISNNLVRLIDLSVRHDVLHTSWAWGAGIFHSFRAPDFRTGETARYRQGPVAGNVYVENKNVAGLTVRAGLTDLISSRQELERSVFVVRRDGPLSFTERRRRSAGAAVFLAVSGNF